MILEVPLGMPVPVLYGCGAVRCVAVPGWLVWDSPVKKAKHEACVWRALLSLVRAYE